MYSFSPKGVCAKHIDFTIEKGLIKNVSFDGGCNGNLQGISKLIEDMPVQEVIYRLRGIDCGGRSTSCPDQLALALEEALKKQAV